MRASRRRQRSRTKSADEGGREDVLERDVPRAGRPVQLVPRRHDERRQQQAVEPWPQRDHGARSRAAAQRAGDRRRHEAARLHDRRQRIADVERALDGVRPHLAQRARAAACPPVRDARRCAAATTQRRPSCTGPERTGLGGRPSDVEVGDAGQVDAARPRQAVPLPEARVHLHQLEAPVARIEPELGLRDAVERRAPSAASAPARRRRRASAPRRRGRCRSRGASARACARRTARARCRRRPCRSRPSTASRRRRGSPPAAAARSRRRCARPPPAPPASRTRARAARSAA